MSSAWNADITIRSPQNQGKYIIENQGMEGVLPNCIPNIIQQPQPPKGKGIAELIVLVQFCWKFPHTFSFGLGFEFPRLPTNKKGDRDVCWATLLGV